MNCQNCKNEILEEYQICKKIGSGSYSDIYLICDVESPKYIGKKLLNSSDSEFEKCKIINSITNVNFAKYVKTINDTIIYQYIDGDSLESSIYYYNLTQFTIIIKNIINQLLELENQGYYYLDINKNNIIIKNNTPYLIDYGTLTHISKFKNLKNKYFGSYGYVPPEYFISRDIIPDKFDIFSIGIILFEYFYNFSPFSIGNYYHLECFFWCKKKENHNRNNCIVDFMNKQPKQINEGYKYLILKCLEFESNKRISLTTTKGLLEILTS